MLASGVAPAILGATDKTDSKPKVIGPEGHRYEVHHDCMKVPAHIRWQDTHGVAVDADGLVYVKHRTMTADPQDAVVVFDRHGKFVRSFGKEFHGGGHGVDIRRDGNQEFLYLCDNKGYIAKSTLKGEIVWKQAAPKIAPYHKAQPFEVKTAGRYGKGHLFSPTNIAFAPDGTKLITGSEDKFAGLWDVRAQGLAETVEHPSAVNASTSGCSGASTM